MTQYDAVTPDLGGFAAFRQLTGGCLRPGGLEGTRQGLGLSGLQPPARILDVGCGAGTSLAFLQEQGFTCLGLDISLPLLGEAQKHGPVAQAEATCLPVPSATVDGLFCECVLSLVEDKAKMLTEFARVLSQGGWLILSDVTMLEQLQNHCGAGTPTLSCGALRPCTGSELRSIIQKAGLFLRAEVDLSHSLKVLAAQIVWHYGSTKAFWQLWQGYGEEQASAATAFCPTPQNITSKSHGYTLFVAQKKSNNKSNKANLPKGGIPWTKPR